ncbi:MAG: glycoside hydrolase family 10 protein [Peptostreptococcaceae bacterium]
MKIYTNNINSCNEYEMRGVWITTVYNIDWPKVKNDIEAQKKEFIDILDKLEELNFNAVFVQVRPKSDAFYKSRINPWSEYLTGTQGKDPGYDPLKFMIQETHKRGMEFHAWLNPYRVTNSGTDLSVLSKNHPARINPDWVISYDNALFYDPENLDVINYIATTVYEIVRKYYVDGIHFDDYFYPYNYPLPEGEDRNGEVANNRRAAITTMISFVNQTINSVRPSVRFGVSPFGVWKNKKSDPRGSDTNNLESYYDIYADSLTWVEEGILDYIVPQVYWVIGNKNSDYEVVVKWWADVASNSNVDLYIGQNINNLEIANEIEQQINLNRTFEEIEGSLFFSMSDIIENKGNVVEQLKRVYGYNL